MVMLLLWTINGILLAVGISQEGYPEYEKIIDFAFGFTFATVMYQLLYRQRHGHWYD